MVFGDSEIAFDVCQGISRGESETQYIHQNTLVLEQSCDGVMLNSIIKKRLPYFELCPRSNKSYFWGEVQFIVRQSLYE